MPLLQPAGPVQFDPTNADHVRAMMEVEITGKRISSLRFAAHPPFQDWMSEARYLMSKAWQKSMTAMYPEAFEGLKVEDFAEEVKAAKHTSKPVIVGYKAPLTK